MVGSTSNSRTPRRWLVATSLALMTAGCGRQEPAKPPAKPVPPVAATPAAADAPDAVAKKLLVAYLGTVEVTVAPADVLPVSGESRPQKALTCTWPATEQPAGSATVQVDEGRGYVSLAILRWPQAEGAKVSEEQLSSIGLDLLRKWTGQEMPDTDVTAQALSDKSRAAFVWDARAGERYSGQRAHVVLSRANGLPVSFAQYQPAAEVIAPKLTKEQAEAAAIKALSPLPEGFKQTGTEARLYEHSPLAKDDGPVWAVAIIGGQGDEPQKAQAGAVIDAVSGAVLAPKPRAEAAPET
ncbi:MAG: hypothetical protein HZB16_00065 [Armatimonadetes bacterium]|nr:hypothetical protein [Armatimonadota bacterium]